MARTILRYGDYRPLAKGEGGYSPTKRQYVSPSTGDVISLRQFQKHATRIEQPATEKQPDKIQKVKKERKERLDKGMSRKDYNRFREQLKQFQADKKRKVKKNISSEIGRNRYESAKHNYIERLNRERSDLGLPSLDDTYIPQETEFYDTYDVIKHPDNYSGDELGRAYDYFWGDEYDENYDYDFPFGETP